MLKIGGKAVHEPQTMKVAVQDVDFESGRTADGTMRRNRVGVKRKISLEFPPMSTAEVSKVLNAVSAQFFQVTYLDPVEGRESTRMFYVGDRTVPVYNFALDIWDKLSFDLVER